MCAVGAMTTQAIEQRGSGKGDPQEHEDELPFLGEKAIAQRVAGRGSHGHGAATGPTPTKRSCFLARPSGCRRRGRVRGHRTAARHTLAVALAL